MKFTIISHACLYIEHLNTRLLIDPWLVGSCYWRSWWNYPEPKFNLISTLKPTHIYISHLHWDHYHGPSLRKMQRYQPEIIFPKHFNKRMKGDCIKGFNFTKIIEIDHGKTYEIGEDFNITSYQFNPILLDSSIVIEVDNLSLLNANDAKVFGLSLKQIISNHKRFDFVLRSHSSASPIPHCIRGADPGISNRSPIDYCNDFINFGKAANGKYLIPFASSHFYLHPDTKKFNEYYSNPKMVKDLFDKQNKSDQVCVLMPSGSTWSRKYGFKLIDHDYSKIETHIEESFNKNKNKIEKFLAKNETTILNKNDFHSYYKKFLGSIYFPLIFSFKFGFLVEEIPTNMNYLCIINGKKKKTQILKISSESDIYKFQLSFVIKTSTNVFNDCNKKVMHNTFTASKLLEIILISSRSKGDLNRYLTLIDLYENDCLPISKLITVRNFQILIRRWREFFDILYYFYVIKIKRKNIADLYFNA